jgi:hypothetical protein
MDEAFIVELERRCAFEVSSGEVESADSEGRAFDAFLLPSTFGAGGLCPRLQEEMADMVK